MTTALEGGEWSAACAGLTLPPGKTQYPFYRRLGGPQGWSGRAENLIPTGVRFWTVQPLVSLYTDWATRPIIRGYYSVYTAIGICHAVYVDWLLTGSEWNVIAPVAIHNDIFAYFLWVNPLSNVLEGILYLLIFSTGPLLQAFHQELLDILKVAAVPFHRLISGIAEGRSSHNCFY